MNILVANWTWYPSGGDWTYIESVCKLYESHSHLVIPFSVHNSKNAPTSYEKYFLESIDYKSFYNDITPLKGVKTAFNSIYSLEARMKLKLLLNETKVDIAQLNNITNYHTPSIIPILSKAKIPIVWRILDYRLLCPNTTFLSDGKLCEDCFKHKYYKCIIKKCKKNSLLASTLLAIESYVYYIMPFYKSVDLFLFQSEFTRDMFVKFGYDIKRTHIIENPYDCNSTKPIYGGKNYILYFGRISSEKGILTLLKAMKTLPNIELKVVGDGPELNYYKSYVLENSLSNVCFLGPKWNKDLEPIINDCEFVIIPSEWHEPSPYVALQAFSYGKPVVASNMGGLNDLIKPDENGIFFKVGDYVNLSEKIDYLFRNKELILKMGMNARIQLENKHNPERYYADTMNIFTDLINSKLKV